MTESDATAMPHGWIEPLKHRDRRTLAKAITYLDDGLDPRPLLDILPESPVATLTIAVTGGAGVGKSTLIAALVKHLRAAGKSVAVLACDPSSPRTGGALLGDRIRMDLDPADAGLYVRSMATRGGHGGLSDQSAPIVELLKRYGFDVVLIETIGVGQDQVAAASLADKTLLVLSPATGDEVQWQKAGLMECAEIIAINKADLGGADIMASTLRQVTGKPTATVTAKTGEGIDQLWRVIVGL